MNIKLMEKMVVSLFFICILFFGCSKNEQEPSLALDDYNRIIFKQVRNYDKSVFDKLELSLKNVQDLILFIQKEYPNFNFEINKIETDDYRNELFVNDFNNGQNYCTIFLNGIKSDAGYSSVYANVHIYYDENEEEYYVFDYSFDIDEEYSDFSGITFSNVFSSTTSSNSLKLRKRKYSDSNDYYWEIVWGVKWTENDYEYFSKVEKVEILDSFLRLVYNTKVFENIDIKWLTDVYTNIETGSRQVIRDLVKWEISQEHKEDGQFPSLNSNNSLATPSNPSMNNNSLLIDYDRAGRDLMALMSSNGSLTVLEYRNTLRETGMSSRDFFTLLKTDPKEQASMSQFIQFLSLDMAADTIRELNIDVGNLKRALGE